MKIPHPRLALLGLAALAGNLGYSAEETANASSASSAETPPAPVAASTMTATPVSAPPGSIRLAGANGREVDFAGIWEARPEGLVVLIDAEAPVSTVAWNRFDLARLRDEQPAIDAARQRAIFLRSPQPINLGLFAGLLTPAQAGSELRRVLDETVTVKVPVRYRTTTTASSTTAITPQLPVVYDGIIVNRPPVVSQNNRTVTETRFSPDELTTSPRRILDTLSRTDGVATQDRRELFELVKTNPILLENTAASLDRIGASLPPRHLLPNDPTVLTLAARLREFANTLRALTTAVTVDYSDQMRIRDLLYLADSPNLR